MKFNSSVFLALIIIVLLGSCKSKLENEDLFIRYINENHEKFDNLKEFHLLIIRFAPLECFAKNLNFDLNKTISKTSDSLSKFKIYILHDTSFSYFRDDEFEDRDNLRFVEDDFLKLNQYGFPFTPLLLKIKDKKIKNWKRLEYRFGK